MKPGEVSRRKFWHVFALTHFNFLFQILQNLGKVDRTSDEIFEEHLQNFTRQQNAANRLQKEFNNYIRCIRGKDDIKITNLSAMLYLCVYILQMISKILIYLILKHHSGTDSKQISFGFTL